MPILGRLIAIPKSVALICSKLLRNSIRGNRGILLSEEFLKPLQLSQEQFAAYLGGTWTQSKMSGIINKKRRVTEAIALDFADAFGSSPEFWLHLQNRSLVCKEKSSSNF